MRTATSDDYLTSGIAYAFHPHRDTWYSAPQCQLNWWLPIYEVEPDNSWRSTRATGSEPVDEQLARRTTTTSGTQTSRNDAAQHVKTDTRKQPKPEEEVELDPQVRVVTPPGGVRHLLGARSCTRPCRTRPARTRFSIDFRTVHLDDVEELRGAPNVDSACTGTTMRDYLRASDFEHLPDEVVAAYDDQSHDRGELVYQPDA